nr:hypothetical protein [Gordonia sp. (in: high G+C Gram-positive bacteria)]
MSNPTVLINSIPVLEAQASSEIENPYLFDCVCRVQHHQSSGDEGACRTGDEDCEPCDGRSHLQPT